MTRARDRTAVTGIGAGIAAGLLWGLAFLLPELLSGWSAVSLTAGRYLAYGVVALIMFLISGAPMRTQARRYWRAALVFAVTGNVGYYLLLVLSVQAVGAPVTGIVIGCIPVVIAVVGNFIDRSYPWRALAAPVLLVTAGLLIVNLLELTASGQKNHSSAWVKFFGFLFAFGAVGLWTWYAVANARFLERHPEVPAAGWSTIIGIATGVVALIMLPLVAVAGQFSGTGKGEHQIAPFIGASIILGFAVSWGGTALWNTASGRLPPTAAGMLINVETLSGYTYVYISRQEWPPLGQLLGFACILLGVMLVVRLKAAPKGHRSTHSTPGLTESRPEQSRQGRL